MFSPTSTCMHTPMLEGGPQNFLWRLRGAIPVGCAVPYMPPTDNALLSLPDQ